MYACNALETKFLNIMRGVTLTAPSALYIGLYLSNPGETGEGVEITYTGYERQPITFSSPAAESGGLGVKNDTEISFAMAQADAGTVTHIGISDSKIGGEMLLYGKLTDDLIVSASEMPVILAGEIVYYLTGNLSNAYKTKFLNILRGQSITGCTPHLTLWSGNPESGGSELAGANYARVPVAFSAPAEAESGQMMSQNSAAVIFNRPTTPWGLWSYTAFYDAITGGEPVWVQEKLPAKEIKRGYMPKVDAGDIKVAIN